jgi:hypothetical protein
LSGSSGADGIFGIALASPASTLTVRAVDLDDPDAGLVEVAGETGAIAAGAFDADQLDVAERPEPSEKLAIAGGCGVEGLDGQERTSLVEGGGDVDVEVRVDTSGDARWQGGHRHPFVWKRQGWHRT